MAMVGLLLKDKTIHEDADCSQITVLQDWCQASKQKMSMAKQKNQLYKPNQMEAVTSTLSLSTTGLLYR